MSKKSGFAKIIVGTLFVLFAIYLHFQNTSDIIIQSNALDQTYEGSNQTHFAVGMWNIQTFGDSKAKNQTLMNDYADFANDFELFIVQELRDKDGSAFKELCELANMSCINSTRAGRSSSKEQYGVMFKDSIQITDLKDFANNESYYEIFERPPFRFTATRNDVPYTFYTIHIKPDDAHNEMSWFDYIINDLEPEFENTIALGDFNADCSYYDETANDFQGWTRIITNEDDTTQGYNDCAYDRVLLKDASIFSHKYGILTKNLTKKHSDHYPIWFELVN